MSDFKIYLLRISPAKWIMLWRKFINVVVPSLSLSDSYAFLLTNILILDPLLPSLSPHFT